MTESIEQFIAREIIERSRETFKAAADRDADATAGLAVAEQKVTDAENMSRLALQGRGTISALDAEIALEAAKTEYRVAEKVKAAALASRNAQQEWLNTARGIGHEGVYVEGVRKRIEAAEREDAARAELAAATAEKRAADDMIQAAVQAGHPRLGANASSLPPNAPAADEARWWRHVGVDLETGTTSWASHWRTQEPTWGDK